MNIEYFSSDPVMSFGIFLFFTVFALLVAILFISIRAFFIKMKYKDFKPSISIIIPSYNEEDNIADTLDSVVNANYDTKKLEVLCVDDGSTDSTRDIIRKFAKKHDFIRLIEGKHQGKSKALNLAVKKAKHEFIMILDADTIIHKDFIKEIVKPFDDENVGATNGIALIRAPKKVIEHFQSVEFYFNNLIRNSFSKVFQNGIWFFGAAACFRKTILEKVGGFRTKTLTEDMDISLKIFEENYEVLTVGTASYYTKACRNVKELFIQRMRWFYGGLQNVYLHKKLFRRKKFSVKYLFFNQIFWTIFSVIIIPLVVYQVFFWLPTGIVAVLAYLFRWFSLAGPVFVLYKIPDWGLSFVNIFGVSAGIITFMLIMMSLKTFKGKFSIANLLVAFFYFPYTLVLNAILMLALIRYSFSKKKHFIK